MNNKIYSMVGIGRKGGKITIGYDATCSDIKNKKSALVIITNDASERTKNNIKLLCDEFKVQIIEFGDKLDLGKSLGREMVSVLSIKDKNIASYLLQNI